MSPPPAPDDRFTFQAEIGKGSFGVVSRCLDSQTGAEVAVKRLKTTDNKEVVARFEREIEDISKLKHPNIMPVLFRNADPANPFLVMPYCKNGSLLAQLQKHGKPLTIEEARRVLRPIAGALEYAHGHGIYHRDLKPENIILSDDGTPLVTDWGLCCVEAKAAEGLTQGGGIGSPPFAAPEQWSEGHADARTDIYSFGKLALFLLTGSVKVRQGLTKAPEAAREAIARMLSSDAGDRPQTMTEAMQWLEDGSVPAAKVKVQPWVLWVGGAALVLATAGAVWWLLRRRPPPALPA